MDAFYTGLLANFGILAMCGLLLASIAPIWRNQRNGLIRYQLIAGMVFGLTTAALILFSTSFVGGTVFDSRAAPAILSGVIGGPWAALITALLGGAARLHIGGEWVLPGVISVVFYCLFGLVYSFALDRVFHRKVSMAHLAPLGAICTIAAIPIFFIGMPYAAAVAVIEAVFVALIVTNTVSVAALGVTLIQSARTAADRQELLIMHSALKRAANGVIITDASAARRIIYANEAAAKITGYKATELLGRSTDIFFGEDAQSEKRRIVRAAAEAGEECSDTFINYRKDGSAFHNHVNLAPVYSRRGHISHFVSVFADVSREMQVQNVLKTVSGQIPTALIYLNLDCQVEFINDAGVRLLALPDRNFRRRPLHEVVPPPILDVLARFIIAAENGREKRAECRLSLPDGDIDARMTSAPTVADNGTQIGVIISIEDISLYKQMEQALAQSERLQSIGTLTGGIAHDFNNLNTVVIGNLDLLKLSMDDGDAADDNAADYIDEALAAARRGAKLTQSLLSFGRKAMLHPDRVDLSDGFADLENLLRSSIRATTEIVFDRAAAALEVDVDQTNLESAILNLVVNADHAIGDHGGEIRVAFRPITFDGSLRDGAFAGDFEIDALGAFAAITVADNGPGVPKDSRDKIIEPFYTTKGRHSGTGLGLAMVHGFVRQSGGFMRISDNDPSGAVVALYLPLADARTKAMRADHGANAPSNLLQTG